MTTPALLPCPFCGGTASLDDSVGGAFVSCDLCEAQGPFIQCEHVDYPQSMFKTVSVAPNGDTIEPPLRIVGDCNDEYYQLREQTTQKAEAAAAAAWNQRSAVQNCPELKNLVAAIDAEYHPESQGQHFTTELCNAIDAARAAVDNPSASAWQPIETAPKDGTKFLAQDGDELLIVWWCDGGRWISDNLQQFHPGEYENPTHWQPLPSPPPITI